MAKSLAQLKADAKAEGWADWIRSEADERAVVNGCWFDVEAGEHWCKFIEKYFRFTKGEFANKPYTLLPWHREGVLMPLFGWKRDRERPHLRRYTKGDIFVAKKQAKALALDTPIATPSGWTTMGDIQPGDEVFDENGLPCRVVAATGVMYGNDCYEMEFSDGEVIVADAGHQWTTTTRRPSRTTRTWTTEQIAADVTVDYAGSAGANHSIPVAGPLMLPECDLPISPYVLGAWLGDGHSASSRLTCAFADIGVVSQIEAEGVSIRQSHCGATSTTGLYQIGDGSRDGVGSRKRSFKRVLRNAGVLGNKHIPPAYMRASHSQRLALLQGLMDTDGTVTVHGQCCFDNTNERLALDVVELLRTLGLKPMLNKKRAVIRGRCVGVSYRVAFYAFDDMPVFRLERKRRRQKARPACKPRSSSRHIVAVRKVPSVPVKCIEVDSPSHHYLAGHSLIPTHNSTLCGALCDAFLVKGGPRTEVYGVAHSTEQAGVIYREAAAFARQSPELSKRLKPLDSQKRIIFEEKQSFYQALAGENGARSAEGIIPNLILFDEIHVQRDRTLYDALAYACVASENSLFLSVSTVGVADETTIWWEQYSYAKGIIDGSLHDDARFAYVAQADEGCKDSAEMRADPAQWRKAMPALGVTVKEEAVRAAVQEAENSPAKLNNLLRYVFNIPTAQVERVIPMDKWAACAGVLPDLRGRECVLALDAASHEDLVALAAFFPPQDDEPGYLKTWFWAPAEKIREREMKQLAHYGTWQREGYLQETSGGRIDHPVIVNKIRELLKIYHISELHFDPWGADAIINPLAGEVECIEVQQGPRGMADYCKTFLDAIIRQRIVHDDNPVMNWCCANCAAETKPDVVWFSKKTSKEKIDGAIAGAMAVGRGLTKPQDAGPQLIVI